MVETMTPTLDALLSVLLFAGVCTLLATPLLVLVFYLCVRRDS